ncbi:MAG: polysaccharide deacetylase family protein [Clostridia bacterium]|nr:polysaccharide deacetylase family protein [Clostridia bacterium]
MRARGIRLILTVAMAVMVLFLAAAGLVFRLNRFKVEFSVPTGQTDTVELGSEYSPPEVDAFLVGKIFYKAGKKIKIKRTGDVDTGKLGTYKLSWSASAVGVESFGVRTINVTDTTPPSISLAPYDKEYLYTGAEYKEPGYTASDAADGDLTGAVTVSDIDTATPGEKEIIYTVSDKSGNIATVSRTVTVKEKPKPKPKPIAVTPAPASESTPVESAPAPANGAIIYLTFDDGPSGYTASLLDILAKYGVKATFFVTGRGDRSLITRAASEGHSIGIHSLSHNYSEIYSSEEAFFADMNAMNQIIFEQTGSYTNIMRFPGGSSNTVSRKYCPGIMSRLTEAVTEQGYVYFDWNVVSGDAGGAKTGERVYTNVINGVRGKSHSVVLQHDTKGFSVSAVESIIVWGLNNGYIFAPLGADSPTAHQRVCN